VIDDYFAMVLRGRGRQRGLERPDEVAGWFARFGADRICLALIFALDSGGEPRVGHTVERRDGRELVGSDQPIPPGMVKHVLCTGHRAGRGHDGAQPDLYRTALSPLPRLAWQASGGVRDAADLAALAEIGVAGAVSGKALLEERITPEGVATILADASSPASTSAKAK